MVKNNRDLSIDVLRCIGLFGLFIAHISESNIPLQIRDFDVQLMVFLSGICFYNPLARSVPAGKEYCNYVKKRFIRLVLPAEIFMLLFFPLNIISYYFVKGTWNINIEEIVRCVTFQTGWYVWIIRVFFVIAVLAPLAVFLLDKTKKWVKVLLLAVVLLFNEVLASISQNPYYLYVIMNIPYLIVFLYGYNLKSYTDKQIARWGFFLVLVFIGVFVARMYIAQEIVWTFDYKYPPRWYYCLYGIAICTLLYGIRQWIFAALEKIHLNSLFVFVGQHTLWIYFWHIPFIYMGNLVGLPLPLRYLMVFTIPIVMTYIQCVIVKRICNRCSESTSKFLSTVLLG